MKSNFFKFLIENLRFKKSNIKKIGITGFLFFMFTFLYGSYTSLNTDITLEIDQHYEDQTYKVLPTINNIHN